MTVDFYTIPQQITLVMASLISGSVSLLASLTIIFIIWRDRQKKLKFVYHRLLFAISILDVVVSLNFAFSFLAVPEGMFWGAQGNTASCEASGFLQILFSAQGLYNFGLAIYYLIIIRLGKSQEFVSRYVEPYIHALSLCVPIGFGCWAIVTDVLNPHQFVGGWCGIAEYPSGCAPLGNCTRGAMADIIGGTLGIGIVLSSLIGIVIIMIMIICHVRCRRAAVTRYHSTRPQLDRTVIQTVRQAMLYIWVSIIPCSIMVISIFVPRLLLALLTKFICPLQGVFNLIIYVWPRYIAMKQKIGVDHSFLTTLRYIVVGEPRPEHTVMDVDDLAPELANPCSFRQQGYSPDPNDEVESDVSNPNRDAESFCSNAEED